MPILHRQRSFILVLVLYRRNVSIIEHEKKFHLMAQFDEYPPNLTMLATRMSYE